MIFFFNFVRQKLAILADTGSAPGAALLTVSGAQERGFGTP